MYDGPIIDIDLHHRWVDETELVEFLPREWRDVVERPTSSVHLEAPVAMFPHTTGTNKRSDAFPDDGPAGSSYELLCEQWLDRFDIAHALLTFDIGTSAGVPNARLATQLCRAANEWNLAKWLGDQSDTRLCGAILVPTQIVADGVAEIRRLGDNPRIAAALLVSNGMGRPFGHPVYHPLFAAAEEYGLPIAIHGGGDQYNGGTHLTAGGMPGSRFEMHTLSPQHTIHHLLSFITNGVFEDFPKLNALIIEMGVSWIPWLMWGLDQRYDMLRREHKRLSRLPSDIFREHVTVSTQPIELTPQRGQLAKALSAVDGVERVLCFASDYPHWDTDDPTFIARSFPKSWWKSIFYDNAARVLRLPATGERSRGTSAMVEQLPAMGR